MSIIRRISLGLVATVAIVVLVPLAGVKAATNESAAAPVQIFDSSNHYLGACSLTSESVWTLEKDLEVTTFQIWYSWNAGETEVGFTITKDGERFAEGAATRSACDPYQKQWCNGDYAMNRTFPAGTYTVKVAENRVCLVPGGTGATRLYGPSPVVVTQTPPTVAVTEPAPLPLATPVAKCSCPNSWSLPALVGSALVNLILLAVLILRKR